jgi:hypothetical protein
MLDTVEKLGDWLDQHPNEEIPEVIGEHEFILRGVGEKRRIRSYCQWMFQRPVDCYQSLSGADKQRADEFLKTLGGYDGMQVDIRRRVKRENYKLVPDN